MNSTGIHNAAVELGKALHAELLQYLIDRAELFDLDAEKADTADWRERMRMNFSRHLEQMADERNEIIEQYLDRQFDAIYAEALDELRYAADEAQYLMNH